MFLGNGICNATWSEGFAFVTVKPSNVLQDQPIPEANGSHGRLIELFLFGFSSKLSIEGGIININNSVNNRFNLKNENKNYSVVRKEQI